MANCRIDITCSTLFEHLSRADQRATSNREVIDHQNVFVSDITNDLQHLRLFVVASPLLAAEDSRNVENSCVINRILGKTGVGTAYDQVGNLHGSHVVTDGVTGVKMIDRDAEEALDLWTVQIHGQHPIRSRRLDRVGTDPGPDRNPRLILLVALRITEKRDHRGHVLCTGPLQSINPEQQLHEIVVDRKVNPLDHVHIPAANILLDAHEHIALAEDMCVTRNQRHPQAVSDGLGQNRIARTRQHCQVTLGCLERLSSGAGSSDRIVGGGVHREHDIQGHHNPKADPHGD